jgi:hypothetical protein
MKTMHPENHWYIVDNTGGVNLDTDDNEVDARLNAACCDTDYPEYAPHKAMQLVDAKIAQDLLNALRMVLDDLNADDGWAHTYICVMNAIKKAEGK